MSENDLARYWAVVLHILQPRDPNVKMVSLFLSTPIYLYIHTFMSLSLHLCLCFCRPFLKKLCLCKKMPRCFPRWVYHFAFLPAVYENFSYSGSCQHLGFVLFCFFNFSSPPRYVGVISLCLFFFKGMSLNHM